VSAAVEACSASKTNGTISLGPWPISFPAGRPAKFNRFFRAKVYDTVFLGFDILEVADDELRAWSPSEHAAVIDLEYSAKFAWIAQGVFNRPIRQVCVLARGTNHNACEQPV
jgi:hypothetical protein